MPRKGVSYQGRAKAATHEDRAKVSGVRGYVFTRNHVVGIACSCLHLSLTPPVLRSAETNWLAAQRRPLDQIKELAIKYSAPIICCGDIFHKWDSSPELINWAIQVLPKPGEASIYAIPGNHDLPLHNYADRRKSAFWTLVEAGVVTPIEPFRPTPAGALVLHGWPFGHPIGECSTPSGICLDIAVVHQYIWTHGCRYKGAPEEQRLSAVRRFLKGYDLAIFGDNHSGFISPGEGKKRIPVMNCGTIITRNANELFYKPMVGLIGADGSIIPHMLDTSEDLYMSLDEAEGFVQDSADFTEFVEELAKRGEQIHDFISTVHSFISKNRIGKQVAEMILKAVEGKK